MTIPPLTETPSRPQAQERLLISLQDDHNIDLANTLAKRFNATVIEEQQAQQQYRLSIASDQIIHLITPQNTKLGIDFTQGQYAHRRQFGGGQGQSLARALASRAQAPLSIVDGTAGFGRDAFVLASLGNQLTLLERSAWIVPLLEQAIAIARQNPETAEIAARMQVVWTDAVDWLAQQATQPHAFDSVYLDPMYPDREQRGKPKKDMQALHELASSNPLDDQALLEAAVAFAKKRVVVKRPIRADRLGSLLPSGSVKSKNTRYDIYPGQSRH